jgi:signal transduction histidine kinase/FixJ family two-component response regulator
MRATSRGIFRELLIGFGALILAVIVQAVIVWTTIDHLQSMDDADDEARTELLHYAVMIEAVLDQESGVNGFVINHDPAFLKTYESGRRRFEAGMPRLVYLAADDPSFMRQRVTDIALQARSWTETVAKPEIDAARAGVPSLRDRPIGKTQIDAIRDDFAVLRANEMNLLELRDGQWGPTFETSRLTLLLGSGAALIFALVLAAQSLRRLILQQRTAEGVAVRLADALERAHAADRAKILFLSNMSHEMRTPLNGVSGMVEALGRTDLRPAQRGLLDVIGASAAILDRLIGDLLTLSRGARAEAQPHDSAAIHLGDAIRAVTADHQASAAVKGVRLHTAVAAEAEVRVIADMAGLEQLLTCLLSNAVKFTDRDDIRLTLEAAGLHRYRFGVTDTGIGFDEDRKAELFETFSQSDGSVTRRHGGAGLGLSLARQLAADLGGQLDCHSRPGEGSVFTFEVDLAPADAEVDESTANSACAVCEPPDEAPLRILVVDDNATNRKVLELILAQLGVEWVSVADGQQAVEAAGRQEFAAILMDIQMPVMDGLTATREIRRVEQAAGRPATPVIIVSANGEPEHIQAGRAAGAQRHLAKPVSAQGLADALNAVLASDDHAARRNGGEAPAVAA